MPVRYLNTGTYGGPTIAIRKLHKCRRSEFGHDMSDVPAIVNMNISESKIYNEYFGMGGTDWRCRPMYAAIMGQLC